MKIHIRQTAVSTSEATIRGHQVSIDRPLEKGGADAGPMGGELFLAAIGGCFMSNLLAAINARKAEVSERSDRGDCHHGRRPHAIHRSRALRLSGMQRPGIIRKTR